MRIPVIFLTLLSTTFGTPSGFVAAPVEVHHPVAVKSHSFASEIQHEIPVGIPPAAAVHAPKSIHAVHHAPAVVIPAVNREIPVGISPAVAVHAPIHNLETVVAAAPKSVLSGKASIIPIGSQIQHEAPVPVVSSVIGGALKSIHAVNSAASLPAIASVVDPAITKSIHAPVVKAFSYATEIQHEAPIVSVAPVSIGTAPKSIHTVNSVVPSAAVAHVAEPAISKSIHAVNSVAPLSAVVPVVDHAVAKSIHAPVVKSFSYATEIQHGAPVVSVAPVAIGAAPKSIHEVNTVSAAAPVAPIVNIQVPTTIHAPIEVPAVKALPYAANVHHGSPISIPVAAGQKSIHAPAAVVQPPLVKTFSHASEIQHEVPVVGPSSVAVTDTFAPKSLHTLSAASIAPKSIHTIAAPVVAPVHSTKSILAQPAVEAPLLKSFTYGTEVQHDAAVNIQAPLVSIAAPKPIYSAVSPAVSSLSIHPSKSIHAAGIAPHHPVLKTAAVPLSAAYSTELRSGLPLAAPINYSPAVNLIHNTAVVPASPGALHAPVVASNLGYHRVVPGSARHSFNIPINSNIYRSHPSLYARIAAPGAHLWNGNAIRNGVGYIAGTTGPFAPVPVYYRNFVNPTNAIYHYYRGK